MKPRFIIALLTFAVSLQLAAPAHAGTLVLSQNADGTYAMTYTSERLHATDMRVNGDTQETWVADHAQNIRVTNSTGVVCQHIHPWKVVCYTRVSSMNARLSRFNDYYRAWATPGLNSIVHGLRGADTIIGGMGSDTFYGNRGRDTLDGHTGSNQLDGGLGDDTCAEAIVYTSCETIFTP